jgi:hypothetical protein
VFVAGNGGFILWYDGIAWQRVRSPTVADLTGVAVTAPAVWFTAYDGAILRLVRSQP